MPLFKGTGRKDTGRTDKYSDETPLKDYQDYRKDYPKENEGKARIEMKKKQRIETQQKTVEMKRQELISLIQNSPSKFADSIHQNIFREASLKKLEELYRSIPVS